MQLIYTVCYKNIIVRVFKVITFKVAEQYNKYEVWDKVRHIIKLFTKSYST